MFSHLYQRILVGLVQYFRAIIAILFLGVSLSGCISPAFPRIIKIGLVAPFEGASRSTGYDAIYAARLAVREINAVSVADGWALELVAYDDRAENNWAQASARSLVSDPDVMAVIGHYSRETTFAASNIYAEAKLPVLIIGEGPEHPTHWHLRPPPHQYAAELLNFTAALSTSAVIWGDGFLVSELSRQMKSQGLIIPISNPDDILISSSIVYSALPAHETAEYLVKWSEQGWQGRLVAGSTLNTPGFASISGKWKERACFVTPYPSPDDISGLDDWIKAYLNTGPHVSEPGPYALPTYEMVYVFADAVDLLLKESKPLNRQQLNWALSSTERTGKLGTISWNENHYWIDPPLYRYCWNETPMLMHTLP